jgi:hypothetical protein
LSRKKLEKGRRTWAPTDWKWIVCGLLPGSIEGGLLLLALSKDRNFGREMGVAKKKR